MRVIAGRLRGRKLAVPEGADTRPITDRVKETIFNILASRCGLTPGHLPEVDALDLFAGTGGFGIEAISRGARWCMFVEQNRATLRVLRENLAHVAVEECAKILVENAWTLRPPRAPSGAFGLVFADPPYRDMRRPQSMLDLLDRIAPVLAPDALVVLRYEREHDFPCDHLQGLRLLDLRAYSRMRLAFLTPPGSPHLTAHADGAEATEMAGDEEDAATDAADPDAGAGGGDGGGGD